jgi:FkbM family methyltransferase
MFIECREHTLFTRGLGPGLTVLDLGANHGQFSADLAALYPGEYHAVEANPELAAMLECPPFASVRCIGVADRTGPIVLHLAKNDEGSSILSLPATSVWDCVEVGRTTVAGIALSELLDLFPGRIDVLKADIEGAEVYALPTLTRDDIARIGQIAVEFHGARVFGLGIHRKARRAIWRLRRLGFVALSFAPTDRDVLFVNRRMHRVSRIEALRWQLAAARSRWQRRALIERARRLLRPSPARAAA